MRNSIFEHIMNGVDAAPPVDTNLILCSASYVIHLTNEACCAGIKLILYFKLLLRLTNILEVVKLGTLPLSCT